MTTHVSTRPLKAFIGFVLCVQGVMCDVELEIWETYVRVEFLVSCLGLDRSVPPSIEISEQRV